MKWFGKREVGNWHSIEIAGHQVRYWQPTQQRSPFGLLYLHDVDETSPENSVLWGTAWEEIDWPIVCPLAGSTWWLDRIVPEFDATLSPASWVTGPVLEWAASKWKWTKVAILGTGMGGQGALRLGFTHPQHFPVVVSLQGSIAFEQLFGHGTCLDRCFASPEECRQQTVGMLLNPRQVPRKLAVIAHRADPLWYRGNDRLHEKLRALGIEHHADLTGDGSEQWWQEQIRFCCKYLREGMQAEARRLL